MKTLKERLSWFSGILDGEGYLSATITKTKASRSTHIGRPKKGMIYEPRVTIERSLRFQIRVANTDPGMILEIASIADLLGVEYFIYTFVSKKEENKKAKRQYGIHFNGKERCKRIVEATLPWLITKRPQGELLLQMIGRRESLNYHMGSLSDPVLVKQLIELRKLNHRGVLVGMAKPVSDQFLVAMEIVKTRQKSFPQNVVGAQRGAEHPHLTEIGSHEEPFVGTGYGPRR